MKQHRISKQPFNNINRIELIGNLIAPAKRRALCGGFHAVFIQIRPEGSVNQGSYNCVSYDEEHFAFLESLSPGIKVFVAARLEYVYVILGHEKERRPLLVIKEFERLQVNRSTGLRMTSS